MSNNKVTDDLNNLAASIFLVK